MTVAKRDKIDRRFKKMCNFARFVRKHINHRLGRAMLDLIEDKWFKSF